MEQNSLTTSASVFLHPSLSMLITDQIIAYIKVTTHYIKVTTHYIKVTAHYIKVTTHYIKVTAHYI